MAKEATKTTEEKTPAPIIEKKVSSIDVAGTALTPFKANEIAAFSKNYLLGLVAQAGLEEEAAKALAQSEQAKQFLSFEMIKAVFSLAIKTKGQKNEIDVYAVFSENTKDVERLNRNVLLAMGVMKKEVDEDDNVSYLFTDESISALYDYNKTLKEKDEAEYERRFRNRKRLNQRLSDAYKSVVTFMDTGLKPEDLFYSENEAGNLVPTLRNAPKAIAGDEPGGVVQLNQRKPVKGADVSPTVASLVKISTDRHKAKADRNDKGEAREPEKMGMTDEAFGQIINSVKRAITKQEGDFTDDMFKQIVSLGDFIADVIKAGKKKQTKKPA